MSNEQVAPALAAAKVQDLDGKSVQLATLWHERPLLLLFIRHFACVFCREQVAELKQHFDEIRAAGTNIAIVGSGSAHFARGFVEIMGLDVPVFTDEKLEAYKAASLERSRLSMVHPGAGIAFVRALFAGSKASTKVEGDAQQQGGTFVILPSGNMAFHYRSRYSGDHPKAKDVVAAAVRPQA